MEDLGDSAATAVLSSSEAAEAAAPSSSVAEEAPSFARHALVWAKVFGFPWWPARVCGCLGKPWVEWEGKYPVRFFHTAERLLMGPDKLLPFASRPDLAISSNIESLKKKQGLRIKFEAAVKEANENPTAGTADDEGAHGSAAHSSGGFWSIPRVKFVTRGPKLGVEGTPPWDPTDGTPLAGPH